MDRDHITGLTRSGSCCHAPQVKICGLTRVEEAVRCASLGVNAIGFVFYAKSPRNISPGRAADISLALPENTFTVGVFVDESFETIMQTVDRAQLKGVQLHGHESPALVDRLIKEHLLVIKTLFVSREPFLKDATGYGASAFLVECGKGRLPGGNARTWDYSAAGTLAKTHPVILAGGLSAQNIQAAVRTGNTDAVDVSSGVEHSPGRKDLKKIETFMKLLDEFPFNQPHRRIFNV